MKKLLAFLSLFTSFGTLLCCALPALFVALGMGAVVAGVVSNVPQLIWLSEHKGPLFAIAACLLAVAGVLQWHARKLACPPSAGAAEVCAISKDYSLWIYGISVVLFLIGAFFAYGPLS